MRSPRHKPRDRSPTTAYFVPDDNLQTFQATQGRWIVLSTGRGNTRLSLAEAYALLETLRQATLDQVEAETLESAEAKSQKCRSEPQ